jgi:hypothetical protein
MRSIALLLLASFCGWAVAQGSSDGTRGSTPPGVSQDGARPAEGAIKGGSIAPGESGGTPDSSKPSDAASGGTSGVTKNVQRCHELEGKLREQCLADAAVRKEPGESPPPRSSSPGAPRD